jgi:ATP-dependent 26S proteasome regulatory subunit
MPEWIKRVVLKRNSMASTVILCECNDDKRIEELLVYVLDKPKGAERQNGLIHAPQSDAQKVLELDFWKGISEVRMQRRDGEMELVRSAVNVEQQITDTDAATAQFRHIKDSAARERMVIVVRGLIQPTPSFDSYLNSVALDDAVVASESTIVVFVPALSLIADVVRQKCIVVDVPLSTQEEREHRIRLLADKYKQELTKAQVGQMAEILSGLNLTQVDSAIIESMLLARKFDADKLAASKTESISVRGDLRVEQNPKFGMESIGGYAEVKAIIENEIRRPMAEPERAAKLGVRPPKGLMLMGMGGTGKTCISRATAKLLNAPLVIWDATSMTGSLYGESERKTSDAIKLIESIGFCIVFIDEIDSIAPKRGMTGEVDGGTSRRTFGQILAWLAKDRECIVIGATNRPQDIDEAFMRVGRFDVVAAMLLPDDEARMAIINVHTKVVRQIPTSLGNSEMFKLVEATKFWNGAEIENLCIRAAQQAFLKGDEQVGYGHFRAALDKIQVNVDERRKQQEDFLKLAKVYSTDRGLLEASEQAFIATPKSRAQLAAEKFNGISWLCGKCGHRNPDEANVCEECMAERNGE